MAEHDDIARRAYERYELRGRTDGDDQDDWFEAERELDGQQSRSERLVGRESPREVMTGRPATASERQR
jgi:hypothetical protein